MQKQLSHHEFKTQQKENKNDIIFVLDNLNLMIYMIPNITVGHIFGKSVILTVVQKTIKAGATGENKKRF